MMIIQILSWGKMADICHLNIYIYCNSYKKLQNFTFTWRLLKSKCHHIWIVHIPLGGCIFHLQCWHLILPFNQIRKARLLFEGVDVHCSLLGSYLNEQALSSNTMSLFPKPWCAPQACRARSDKSGSINWPSGSIGKNLQWAPQKFWLAEVGKTLTFEAMLPSLPSPSCSSLAGQTNQVNINCPSGPPWAHPSVPGARNHHYLWRLDS